MLRLINLCILSIVLLSYTNTGLAQSANTVRKWRQDLRFLVLVLVKGHKDVFHNVSKEDFHRSVISLEKKIPVLSRSQIIVEMARIVAMLRDGHTQLRFISDNKIGFRQIPLRLYFYSDGLFVQSVAAGKEGLLGARVIRIGKMSVDEALRLVIPILPRENEMSILNLAPMRFVIPEVLASLGITDDIENTEFEFETIKGERLKVSFKPNQRGASIKLINASDKAQSPLPLYLKDPQNNYWFEYLKEPKIVYVKFNAVENNDGENLQAFFDRVFKFVEENPVNKFILDMRNNGGGDNTLINPIITGILKSDKINVHGKFFTIIGRVTFSAAQNLVNELEKHTNTIFVGEPTGSRPNFFADAESYQLPNSQITLRVSALWWQDQDPRDYRKWTAPQISAELSSQDYLTNHDAAFEAIINYQEDKSLSQQLQEIITEGHKNHFEIMRTYVRHFKSAPEHKFYDVEKDIAKLGFKLLEMKKEPEAVEVFKLNCDFHTTSAVAFHNLAEAYEQTGSTEMAIENYQKSLMYEQNENMRFWLRLKVKQMTSTLQRRKS